MYRFSPDLWRICLVRCAWLAAMASTWAAAAEPVDFNRQVAPILVKRCLECHSESVASGDLVLTSHERLLAGGASGVVVVPGDPDSSLLLERVTLGEMPPEKKGKSQQLPDEEIETLRAWIAGGAPWPAGRTLDPYESTTDSRAGRDWWSWQPIQRATPPTPPNPGDAANPIDAFILARLDTLISASRWGSPPISSCTIRRQRSSCCRHRRVRNARQNLLPVRRCGSRPRYDHCAADRPASARLIPYVCLTAEAWIYDRSSMAPSCRAAICVLD